MSILHRVTATLRQATVLRATMWLALAVTLFTGAALGMDDSDYWFCNRIEDFLDCRPYYGNAKVEAALLQWGTGQGIPDLQGDVLPGRRLQALDSVYRLIINRFLPGVVAPKDAPDAGVKVVVGEPSIVMFAPEGKTNDQDGNRVRLGHLAPSIPKEGRWGQFMFPEINRLRGGLILVRVSVGGDADRNYLNFVSDDGGRNWRHIAQYFEGTEMPSRDWSALRLPNGEEIKTGDLGNTNDWGAVRIKVSDPGIKSYDGYYRLGDLPRELQSVPLYRRKPGEEAWVEEKAYLDPDLLVKDRLPNPITGLWLSETKVLPDGSIMSRDLRLPVMSCLRPDGTFDPAYPYKYSKHHFLRSHDGGRKWKVAGNVPGVNLLPFPDPQAESATVRACLNVFPNGNWVAAFRHHGLYSSAGGPLIIRKSSDQGKTWSAPKAIRMPGANPLGLMLQNGIAVFSYQRPGVFLTFCADGRGDLWGNDVTLVRPWRRWKDENSCCNGSFLATGPDRFIYIYTKWDVPDPWGQPRQAVIAQEFVVSKK